MRVAVIGASNDRAKFGHKAVRAYLRRGHDVFPVNPSLAGQPIEGRPCVASIRDVAKPIDRVLFYVPPAIGAKVLPEVAAHAPEAEIWLNPGADGPEALAAARGLGLMIVRACAIVDIGEHP